MPLSQIEFFTKLADPKFADNFNLSGNKNGRLFIAERRSGGSLFGRTAERTQEIVRAASLLAEEIRKPSAFKGLTSQQLTNISMNLKTLQERMMKYVGSDYIDQGHVVSPKLNVSKNMEAAIQNVDSANSYAATSILPTTSTVLTCLAVVVYTTAAITGLINPVIA